jgi:hypothetical protein
MSVLAWLLLAVVLVFCLVVLFGAPYVPSRPKELKRLFGQISLSKKDVLVDVGSGDGVVLRAAAPLVKQAIGYEINPILVLVAKLLSIGQANVRVCLRNFLAAKLPADTSVVYVFGVQGLMPKLERKICEHVAKHAKPIRVISYGFKIVGRKPQKRIGAYYLYEFGTLQTKKT